MTMLRNRPRLQFTFTPNGKPREAHLLRGHVVFAKGSIEVQTRTGSKCFPWSVPVKRGVNMRAAVDLHVQHRAYAMGWAPAA